MKSLLAIIVYALLGTALISQGGPRISQKHNKLHQSDDSIMVTKKLPILTVDSCIGKLLQAVVNSNAKHYQAGESFYGLNFQKQPNCWALGIWTEQRHGVKDTAYTAMIKMNGGIFLCKGDLNESVLFSKTTMGPEQFELVMPSTPVLFLGEEPVLRGTLHVCKGLPIYTEIFAIEPITGYKMTVNH